MRCDLHYAIPRDLHIAHSPAAPHVAAVTLSPAEFPSRDSVREGVGPVSSTQREPAATAGNLQGNALEPIHALAEVVRKSLGVMVCVCAIAPDDEWAARLLSASSPDPAAVALYGTEVPLLAVLGSEVRRTGQSLLIEDTRVHRLIRGAPIVSGLRILSCLAAPLRDASGGVHGALLALDSVPRWWNDADLELLRGVAVAAAALLSPALPIVAPSLSDAGSSAAPASTLSAVAPGDFECAVLESLADGVIVLDETWVVRWCNEAAANSLGVTRDELLQHDVRQALGSVVDVAVLAAWQRAIDVHHVTRFSWHHQPSGRWFDGIAAPGPAGLTITVRDTTLSRVSNDARVRRVAQSSEMKKLEAIGLLAGGVAHDFNNLLTVIAANSELLQQLPLADDGATELSEIQRAAKRASDLTRQLLAFSGQQLLEPELVEMNQVIANLDRIVRKLLPLTVHVETSLTTYPTTVNVDVAQFEQVIINLVTNARDAMTDGGTLQLATRLTVLAELHPARPAPVPPGHWVVLSVRDTGHGIPPQVLERVFEPFFTTRDVGAGTGLGLATAFGMVAQSGGCCTVESATGQGATFEIWLPAHRA